MTQLRYHFKNFTQSNNSRSTRTRVRSRRRHLLLEPLEQRLPLSAETFLINFQLEQANVPNQYLEDAGQIFGDRGNGLFYGWSSNHTDVSRDRGVNADQRLDTLVHFHQFQDWEFQLTTGTYDVTVSIGDPSNASTHTLNVEGVSYWNAVPLVANDFRLMTQQITVTDGRLTIDQGNAGEKDTRINFVHIQGLAPPGNAAPSVPTITEPAVGATGLNPVDVHMEAVDYFDPDGDSHFSSDWEIWTVGAEAERVWFTLGITGVERLHTHLGDGFFEKSHAGRFDLLPNTEYELRVRFRDDVGSVSDYATRSFETAASSTIFPLEIEDIASSPEPTWVEVSGRTVELPSPGSILSATDAILAIDLDGDSSYPVGESPQNAIDGTTAKYLNFGKLNSGFIVTPGNSPSIVDSFQLTTANDAEERDPTAWQLFGTNELITSGDNSTGMQENWTLVDSGSVALPAARNTAGPIVSVNNTAAYDSYRVVFTDVKNAGAAESMQIAEIQFFGELVLAPILAPTDPIIAVDLDGNSGYPNNEEPDKAIDRTLAKYLNFGEMNSGFIVTPLSGSSTVERFQITTANDEESRDPTAWQLYGTNDPITSTDNSTGTQENWTLIDSGSVSLPSARDTLGPVVEVTNNTAYASYRMIITGVKNAAAANSMQFAEIQFFGNQDSGPSTPPSLRVDSGDGDLLLLIEGTDLAGNLVTNPEALAEHVDARVVISGGSTGVSLGASNLSFQDAHTVEHTVCLPSFTLPAEEDLYLWVAVEGSTYYGTAAQTEPVFTSLARDCQNAVNFIATQPNFIVEEVAGGFQLPVNVAFIPNQGTEPDDPSFYVTELYGTIKVVTNDGTVSDYATNLLNFDPTGNFPGSGEQGLAGIVVDPVTGDVFVTRVTDTDGFPGGAHHPQVLRFTSNDGGLTAATQTVLLDMVGETQGQSHQISNVTIGPDGKLFVHNGDGFDASTALNLDSYRGKVLRMNLDGSAPNDNPFYNANNGINSRDYIFAYGFRNPFGGAWRASDGMHYEVENGPSVDRFAQVIEGGNYGWNGSNTSMFINAIYNWDPAHAPVNITFVQPETLGGSMFPTEKMDRAFVSESGPTYAAGPQALGKRIVEFELDASGQVVGGPTTLVEYVGPGRATVVGLTAGPDGLYFTDLYKDEDAQTPIDPGARVLRVRYVPPLPDGDFNDDGLYNCTDIDQLVEAIVSGNNEGRFDLTGDGLVDLADRDAWLAEAGAANLPSGNAYLLGDATLDGIVDGLDFIQWNNNKFTSLTSWCGGDFTADGIVDGLDFIEWNTNKFQAADGRDIVLTAPPSADSSAVRGAGTVDFVWPEQAQTRQPQASRSRFTFTEFVTRRTGGRYDRDGDLPGVRRLDAAFDGSAATLDTLKYGD